MISIATLKAIGQAAEAADCKVRLSAVGIECFGKSGRCYIFTWVELETLRFPAHHIKSLLVNL